MLKPKDRVVVCKPVFSQGGRSFAQDKFGTVQTVSGRFIVLVLDGERDELGFFEHELELLTDEQTESRLQP